MKWFLIIVSLGITCLVYCNHKDPLVESCGTVIEKLRPKEYTNLGGHGFYIIYLNEVCVHKELSVSADLYYKLKVGSTVCIKVRKSTLSESNCE